MKENNIVCTNCEEVLTGETATKFDGRVVCLNLAVMIKFSVEMMFLKFVISLILL